MRRRVRIAFVLLWSLALALAASGTALATHLAPLGKRW